MYLKLIHSGRLVTFFFFLFSLFLSMLFCKLLLTLKIFFLTLTFRIEVKAVPLDTEGSRYKLIEILML